MEKSLKTATKAVAFKCKLHIVSRSAQAMKDILKVIEDHPDLKIAGFEKDVVPIKTFSDLGKF